MGEEIEDKGADLITKVAQLFMRYGIKSMTMDDISRHLGVSKKTLYQYVTDKNDLVYKVMESVIDREKASSYELCERYENAIDMLFALSKEIAQRFGRVHPSINYDLQKYHPESWAIFNEFRTDFVTKCVEENIERGIKQGLYRDNLDPFLIARFHSSKLHMCTDGEMFPPERYTFSAIHLEMMRYHVRGIASEKGLEYLKEKVKKENYEL